MTEQLGLQRELGYGLGGWSEAPSRDRLSPLALEHTSALPPALSFFPLFLLSFRYCRPSRRLSPHSARSHHLTPTPPSPLNWQTP